MIRDILQFPLPQLSVDQCVNMTTVVNEILIAKRHNIRAETTSLEDKIDKLVYEAYGLNEDEIAIIESATHNSQKKLAS